MYTFQNSYVYCFIIAFFVSTSSLNGQGVGINTDNDPPDASAMLDVSSQSKGVLIPRMNSFVRGNIVNPATGLLVYDTNTQSFWYHNETSWTEIGTSTNALIDSDGDTYVHVELNPDQDSILFMANGELMGVIDERSFHFGDSDGSIYIGKLAGAEHDGTDHTSTALGYEALRYDSTGWNNTAIGYKALSAANAGDNNVAVGGRSLENTQYGDFNTAVGQGAMIDNGSGTKNVALGYRSLKSNKSGFENTALGYEALPDIILGKYNIGIGQHAGIGTEGTNNIFIGNNSGSASLIDGNVLIGHNLGGSLIGSNLLAIGSEEYLPYPIEGEFDKHTLNFNGLVSINNNFSFPQNSGSTGQLLKLTTNGKLEWQDDDDNDATNEIQTLTLDGNELSLSGANMVTLPSGSGIWTQNSESEASYIENVGVGILNPSGDLHINSDETVALKIEQFETGLTSTRGIDVTINNGPTPNKKGINVNVNAINSTSGTGIESYITPNPSSSSPVFSAIKGISIANAIGIHGVANDVDGIAGYFEGTTHMLEKATVGTDELIGQFHIHSSNLDSATVVITPDVPSTNGKSQLFFAEDKSANFGMYWKYDGSEDAMQIFGKVNSNIFGSHLSIKRNSGDVAIGNEFANGYKLSVDGKVMCEELQVQLQNDWPDYVFKEDYELMHWRNPKNSCRKNRRVDTSSHST